MSLEMNTRYIRTAPSGDQNVVIIESESDLKYHVDLLDSGFTYKEIVVHSGPPESSCISCEG